MDMLLNRILELVKMPILPIYRSSVILCVMLHMLVIPLLDLKRYDNTKPITKFTYKIYFLDLIGYLKFFEIQGIINVLLLKGKSIISWHVVE